MRDRDYTVKIAGIVGKLEAGGEVRMLYFAASRSLRTIPSPSRITTS